MANPLPSSASLLLLFCWLAAQYPQAKAGIQPSTLRASVVGANENSPVLVQDGLLLQPNNTADGAGCVAFYNKMPTGRLLAEALQRPTLGDCCRACRETPPCNAFAWCPREGGCATGSSYSNVAQLPYQGCALLYQGLSDPATGRPTLAIPAPGFAGGAPISVADSPELPGYQRLPGRGFFNRYDIICEGSAAASSCMLWGRAQQLAPRCDADPRCRIMIDLPHGWDYLGGAMTSLKGGRGCTVDGNTSEGALNPNANVYIKLSPPPLGQGSMSIPVPIPTSLAELAVGAVVGAAGVLVCCLTAKRWRRQPAVPAAPAALKAGATSCKQLSEGLPAIKPRREEHDSTREELSPFASHPDDGRTAAWVQSAGAAGEGLRARRTFSSGPAGCPVDAGWLNLPSFSIPSRISSLAGTGPSGDLSPLPDRGGSRRALPSSAGSLYPPEAAAAASASGPCPPPLALAPAPSMLPSPFRAGSDVGFDDVPSPFADTTPRSGPDGGFRSGARADWSCGGRGGVDASSGRRAREGSASDGALPPSRPSDGTPLGGRGSWGPISGGPSRLPGSQGTPTRRSGPISGVSAISGHSNSSATQGSAQVLSRMPEQHWEDWVVDFEAIEFNTNPDGSYQSLGSGGFGTVYYIMLDGVQPYAAKVLDLGVEGGEMEAVFLREASLLQRLRHQNIVGFRGVSMSEGRGVIIMELMEGGDLFSRLGARNKATGERLFSWYNRGKRVALDVARGIHYLHSLSLTHFDIKANNILLTRDLSAKIADVGFTRAMATTHHSIKDNRIGTFAYMAPELLMGGRVTNSVDIFSFGVLLWEICSGEHPSRGQLRPLRVPEEAPQQVADLCEECMAVDPAARPSGRKLVERLAKLMASHPPPGVPPDRR